MKAGQVVGDYELKWRLGEGVSGQVWRGVHKRTGEQAAVKLLRDGAPLEARDLFRFEARMIARLIHPHIVSVFEFGDDYLVTAFIDGCDLASRLESTVSPALAMRIIRQIGSAVAHAHASGVIHRDIKPANILLDCNDNAFLADFGLARLEAERESDAMRGSGTPAYMAPEQARCEDATAQSDQYALARTMLEMLLGKRVTADHAADLAQLPEALPATLRDILTRALQPQRSLRWPRLREFIDALAAVDLRAYAAPTVLASAVRGAHPFAWVRTALQVQDLEPNVREARFRLTRCVEHHGIESAAAARFTELSAYRELGWSLFTRVDRLGEPSDPEALARAKNLVVIVPGMASPRETWRHIAHAVCRDNAQTAVLTTEFFGFGESRFIRNPPDDAKLTARTSMTSQLAWLELLGLDQLPSCLVGHSVATEPLLAVSDSELGSRIARLAIAPTFPFINPKLTGRAARRFLAIMSALVNAVPAFGSLSAILLSKVAEQSGRRILPEFQQPTVREMRNYPMPLCFAWLRAGFGESPVPGSQLRRCKILSGTQDEWTPDSIVEQAVQTLQIDRSNLHWCLSRDHHPHLPKRDQPEEAARNVAQIINLINILLRDVSVDSSLESEEARTVTS